MFERVSSVCFSTMVVQKKLVFLTMIMFLNDASYMQVQMQQ
jgi:hypothetical protein